MIVYFFLYVWFIFNISYFVADGDSEFGVPKDRIKVKESAKGGREEEGKSSGGSDSKTGELEKGSVVTANFKGRGKWFPGKITRVNRDGTFDIKFDDGDSDFAVPRFRVRPVAKKGGSGGGSSDRLEKDTEVTVNFKGRGRWFPGKITRVNRDDTFDVKFDGQFKSKHCLCVTFVCLVYF